MGQFRGAVRCHFPGKTGLGAPHKAAVTATGGGSAGKARFFNFCPAFARQTAHCGKP